MAPWTIIGVIISVIILIVSILFEMNSSINNRINEAVNHPNFIEKVAKHTKLPFIIINDQGSVKWESGGATSFIEKIESFKEKDSDGKERFAGFIIYPKQFLNIPPILQAINNKSVFAMPKNINTIDWKYRIPEFDGAEWGRTYDEPPAKLYKIEIIK